MSKITEFARGRPCTIRLSGICNHNVDTSVWVHLNSVRWGSGRGQKANDLCGAIACSSCHDAIDRRVKTDLESDFIKLCALEAHMESLALLVKVGIVS